MESHFSWHEPQDGGIFFWGGIGRIFFSKLKLVEEIDQILRK
jgi:hypothetical protein